MLQKTISSVVAAALLCTMLFAGFVLAGEIDPQQSEWFKKYKDQDNVPQPGKMLLNTDSEPELSSGFIPLFNGSDLTGWAPKGGDSEFTAKDWNRLTIMAKGNVVKTWVNGVPAAHWVDNGSYPKGFFGLQIHKGKEGTVLWRDLRVKELTP